MSELSKRDADALGIADMTGSQLRWRVFQVEGLMCELGLALDEMLQRFAPTDDGLGDAEIAAADRARDVIASVRERYSEIPREGHADERKRIVDWLRQQSCRRSPHDCADDIADNNHWKQPEKTDERL